MRSILVVMALIPTLGACAHQTTVETDPPGAEVYVNGDKVGHAPVSFEDEGGWSRSYEITVRKDGYELHQTSVEQGVFNPVTLAAAGICGVCTCGLAALYLVPRSRHLEDRYRFVLKRKQPLPPVQPSPEPAPAPGSSPSPDAPPAGSDPQVVPMGHPVQTGPGSFRY
ncbi:MAG: PEGA domain-containing protein [Myxococcota bacterium]